MRGTKNFEGDMQNSMQQCEPPVDSGGALRALNFIRSGDYVGIERRGNLSLETMNAADFADLNRLVESVFPLRRQAEQLVAEERRKSVERRAQCFEYSLVMVRDRRTDNVVLNNANLDDGAAQLLRFLDARSKPAL
jgi:hypothetical protein